MKFLCSCLSLDVKKIINCLINSILCVHAANELQGKLGKKVSLENRISKTTLSTGDETMLYSVTFDWDADIGTPGVFLIYNGYENKFFLESLILEDVPDQGRLHFICNSWIYPSNNEEKYRVFFINKVRNQLHKSTR